MAVRQELRGGGVGMKGSRRWWQGMNGEGKEELRSRAIGAELDEGRTATMVADLGQSGGRG